MFPKCGSVILSFVVLRNDFQTSVCNLKMLNYFQTFRPDTEFEVTTPNSSCRALLLAILNMYVCIDNDVTNQIYQQCHCEHLSVTCVNYGETASVHSKRLFIEEPNRTETFYDCVYANI